MFLLGMSLSAIRAQWTCAMSSAHSNSGTSSCMDADVVLHVRSASVQAWGCKLPARQPGWRRYDGSVSTANAIDVAHAVFQAAWDARREAEIAQAQTDYEASVAIAVPLDADAELAEILRRSRL